MRTTLHVTVTDIAPPTHHINTSGAQPFAAVNFAGFDSLHVYDPAELRAWAATFARAADELTGAQARS